MEIKLKEKLESWLKMLKRVGMKVDGRIGIGIIEIQEGINMIREVGDEEIGMRMNLDVRDDMSEFPSVKN